MKPDESNAQYIAYNNHTLNTLSLFAGHLSKQKSMKSKPIYHFTNLVFKWLLFFAQCAWCLCCVICFVDRTLFYYYCCFCLFGVECRSTMTQQWDFCYFQCLFFSSFSRFSSFFVLEFDLIKVPILKYIKYVRETNETPWRLRIEF